MCSTLIVSAQDAENEFTKLSERKKWSVAITPYALLASQSTDVGGEKLRQSFNDLSSLTNFGFQMSVGARYKRLTLGFDGTFAKLGTDAISSALNVKLNIDQLILDNKLGYILYDNIHFNSKNIIAGWSIEANIGAKYWLNDVNVDYTLQIGILDPIVGSLNEKQEWADLMLGVKAKFILSRSVYLAVGGNIGGFGIGNSSKFSWDFTYVNTFKITNLITISAGYRTFKYRRVDGEGADQLETSVSVFGPMLGVSFVL